MLGGEATTPQMRPLSGRARIQTQQPGPKHTLTTLALHCCLLSSGMLKTENNHTFLVQDSPWHCQSLSSDGRCGLFWDHRASLLGSSPKVAISALLCRLGRSVQSRPERRHSYTEAWTFLGIIHSLQPFPRPSTMYVRGQEGMKLFSLSKNALCFILFFCRW